ncbi:MAG: CDP-diacylglycerol--glycerol-3-phosphate 3-phosphatidyltransferase [Elusimicrobia bacterium RIFOXYB2_FULL_48_7]|nr:MAG: CDP-diacylglycerol--glycerol-3-phosphate 3-phosphatidyltransferase [Elusimicrobia bacterium RIFOXYB2_FULL_48_7]
MINLFNKVNIATKLTLLRIVLVPFFMTFMFFDNVWTRVFALFIFIIAGVTDLFDGMLARKFKSVTKFGIFLDPLADKLIISAAFISFVSLKELHIPAWMVVFIISRDFIITGLRLVAVSHDRVIAADKTGKFKTTSQIVGIIIILLILIMNSFKKHILMTYPFMGQFLSHAPFWIMLYVTVLTVYSGVAYLNKNKDVLILDTEK